MKKQAKKQMFKRFTIPLNHKTDKSRFKNAKTIHKKQIQIQPQKDYKTEQKRNATDFLKNIQ